MKANRDVRYDVPDGRPIRYFVVYDKNVYMRYNDTDFQRLHEQELSLGIRGMANHAVLDEILYRLLDADSKKVGECHAALRRLVTHCITADGGLILGLTQADMFGRIIFGLDSESMHYDNQFQLVVGLLNEREKWSTALKAQLQQHREQMDRDEEMFMTLFDFMRATYLHHLPILAREFPGEERRLSRKLIDDDAEDFKNRIAQGNIKGIAQRRSQLLTSEELPAKVALFRRVFKAYTEFTFDTARNVLAFGEDYRLRKNFNDMWDSCILSTVLSESVTAGVPMRFVTDDRKLSRVAANCGVHEVVETAQYLRDICLPQLIRS